MKTLVAGYRTAAALALCWAGLMLFGPLQVASAQIITISPGLDGLLTGPGTDVDLPPVPGGTLFGPGSDPFPGAPGFALTSHPFPDQFGFPTPFPASELNLSIEFVDPHGNVVGPDSVHAVGAKVQSPSALVPFNFDTVVRRHGPAAFTGAGQTQPVPIEMEWLSLKSVAPITVTYGSDPAKMFDIYVGLSDTAPQTVGRMLLESTAFDGSSVSGTIDMGEIGDPVDQQFMNVNENTPPNPFFAYQSFFGDPNALGLPVTFQIRFVEVGNPSNVIGFENPVGHSAAGGEFTRTVAVFHNTSGDFAYVPEPSTFVLAALGLLALVGTAWRRRRGSTTVG